jgi:leucyl aminopeptidase
MNSSSLQSFDSNSIWLIFFKVALVGKGLTFDSGGYNLKVGAGSMIELMKFDMGGCAAVLGCAKAIAQLRPKVSI